MTPTQGFAESQKLWRTYLLLGGSLDPEPDSQSPFYDPETGRTCPADRGQACVLYGGAEFSRDIDLAILADEKNLARLEAALQDLKAEPVYFPPLTVEYLRRGRLSRSIRDSASGTGFSFATFPR